ncbi:MAG: SpoIIE family protein phosphatase [Bacteroidota bacterium]
MSATFFSRSSKDAAALLVGSRFRFLLALGICVGLFLLGFGFHELVRGIQAPAPATLAVIYHVGIVLCFALVWILMNHVLKRRQTTPARVLWRTLVIGLLLAATGWGVSLLGRPASLTANGPIGILNGVPLSLATTVKMSVLSLLETFFAFLVLIRFRELVLFKRTRRSERNWYLMLSFMVIASLSAFMAPPQAGVVEDLFVPTGLLLIPAVVLMTINSFRLSWVIFLPWREKVACIGLTAALLALLAFGPVQRFSLSLVPDADEYLLYYSYPLQLFVMQGLIFAILYCTTTFLSLLFHLPTTGDFQQKVGEMAALQSLTNLVNQVFDFERLTTTIVASPIEAGSAQKTWLAMPDPQSGTLRPKVVASYNLLPEHAAALTDVPALYSDVQSGRDVLILEEAATDHRIEAQPGEGIGSLLALPLIARDEMLGVLFVVKEVSRGFEQDDVEALGVFAAQAALALDNARLFEEQLEKERLARELYIAREVQQKLLPQELPQLAGLSIAASSVSAQEVGGDYFDFLPLGEKRFAFIVADVSGKGTSAAFYMAELRGIFHSVGRLTETPKDFLAQANEALSRSLDKNVFVTVIYGIVDLETETLQVARAGHAPAAVIGIDGRPRYVRSRGLGLGLDRGPLFKRTLEEETLPLRPGDVFVFYTDGVVESRDHDDEEYGYDRLLDALCAHRHEEAQALHDALLEDLNVFLGTAGYDDDLTLVVLKWHGLDLFLNRKPQATAQKTPEAAPILPENV